MKYNFDLHSHTFFSQDARHSPEEMIAAAKAQGLHGIAITDHDSCDAFSYLEDKGLWSPQGNPIDDFLVIPGVEVSTAEGHLLCLGTQLPRMKGQPAAKVVKAIHEHGGLAVAPHPFDRFRAGIRPQVLDQLPLDALEVFNAAVSLRHFNNKARKYAFQRGLAMTAASDAHYDSVIGISYTSYELNQLSLKELLRAIPQGGELHQEYLSWKQALQKTVGNWLRCFHKNPYQPGPHYYQEEIPIIA